MLRLFSSALLVILFLPAFGQSIEIAGRIVNEKEVPLPFAHVVIKRSHQGTASDVEGRFRIHCQSGDTIEFRYVGYEILHQVFEQNKEHLLVVMKESTSSLQEIIVRPDQNPALRIIQKVINNKDLNDPDQLPSYTYQSYNKLVCSLALTKDASVFGKDSTRVTDFLKKNDAFISESYTLKKYLKPDHHKEIVLGNRFSGIKDPFFAFLATDLQPFGFYREFIPLLGTNYLNPIGPGALSRYDYTLMDTVVNNLDSVFVISFEPLAGKVFDALKGQLHISTDGYAIENVIAQPADNHQLMEARVQQQYKKVGVHWFPAVLNSEIIFHEYEVRGIRPYYYSRSYISDVSFDVTLTKKDFDLLQVSFAENANRQSENYWKGIRLDSISSKEKNTYKLYDSIKTRKLNTIMKFAEGAMVGKFKVGSFYLPAEHLMRFNQYEGFRPGLALQTGESLSKLFHLEAYAAYGFRDQAFKYGGGVQFNLNPRHNSHLLLTYSQDVIEPGNPDYIRANPLNGSQAFRRFLAARMDSVTRVMAMYETKPLKYVQLKAFVLQEKRNPTYSYAYQPNYDPTRLINTFTSGIVGFQARLAFHETYTQIGNFSVPTQQPNPLLQVGYSQSFKGWLDGGYDFTKIEMQFDHSIRWPGGGKTSYEIALGTANGQLPYPYLFNGRGTLYAGTFSQGVLIQNYFQTMDLYEFVSDQYAYLFFQHNFGRLTGTRSKYFRPELSLLQNSGWGSLRNPEEHQGINFKTMEKGFFEGGVTLTNLVRFKYVNLLYFGLGGGYFYRYGAYARPASGDNGTWKLFLTLTL